MGGRKCVDRLASKRRPDDEKRREAQKRKRSKEIREATKVVLDTYRGDLERLKDH